MKTAGGNALRRCRDVLRSPNAAVRGCQEPCGARDVRGCLSSSCCGDASITVVPAGRPHVREGSVFARRVAEQC
jgi:hypothetical protein